MRLPSVNQFGFLALILLSLAAGPATRSAGLAERTVRDLANVEHRLPDPKSKATVLLFVGIECPVSNGYVPEINRLAKAYSRQSVMFVVIYSGADVTPAAAEKHVKAFAIAPPAVVDADCSIANAVGATMTLEAAVVLADGSLVYRGRIDDQYASLGKKRFAASTHDLQDVLDDVLAGKAVEPRFTRAVGCAIVKPDGKKP